MNLGKSKSSQRLKISSLKLHTIVHSWKNLVCNIKRFIKQSLQDVILPLLFILYSVYPLVGVNLLWQRPGVGVNLGQVSQTNLSNGSMSNSWTVEGSWSCKLQTSHRKLSWDSNQEPPGCEVTVLTTASQCWDCRINSTINGHQYVLLLPNILCSLFPWFSFLCCFIFFCSSQLWLTYYMLGWHLLPSPILPSIVKDVKWTLPILNTRHKEWTCIYTVLF